MRIIGGHAGGRVLRAPKGLAVRPTPDLVRQAIFNSLAARIPGARVLELFAGTGALSLECLSRGAEFVRCVEHSHKHAEFLRRNAAEAQIEMHRLQIRVQDAFTSIRQWTPGDQSFDIILADPPYGEKNIGRRSDSFAQQMLDEELLPRWLATDGLFVLGHARRDTLTIPDRWESTKMLKHGDSIFQMFRPNSEFAS